MSSQTGDQRSALRIDVDFFHRTKGTKSNKKKARDFHDRCFYIFYRLLLATQAHNMSRTYKAQRIQRV